MSEHFTRNTVSAQKYCAKCAKVTAHRIDHDERTAGRFGPCLECIARLEVQHNSASPKVESEKQQELFA
jgi:hypothetical protein